MIIFSYLVITGTVGLGFTVMLNVIGVPVQVLLTGVTIIVAVTVEFEVLVAVKETILPVPLADKPIEGLLFVQLSQLPPAV